MERDRPWWGVTNDAVVRLPDHAPDRAIRTNACSVFIQAAHLAMSIRTLTQTHQLVASARAGHGHNSAPDNPGALEPVEQSEASTDSVVAEAMGDAAYGDGNTRQAFADAGRRLVAKAPGRPDRKHFPKHDFQLDLAAGSCTCPAGPVTRTIVPTGKRTDRTGRVYRLQAFQFDGETCGACARRPECIAAQGSKGRRVQIHPQEALLQEARALQQSAAYDEYRARRMVVEHRLARLVQLGIRQARYFGRVKTRFQLYLAATVANLTLVLGNIGRSGSTGGGAAGHRVVLNVVRAVVANAAANFSAVRLGQLWSLFFLSATRPNLAIPGDNAMPAYPPPMHPRVHSQPLDDSDPHQ